MISWPPAGPPWMRKRSRSWVSGVRVVVEWKKSPSQLSGSKRIELAPEKIWVVLFSSWVAQDQSCHPLSSAASL